MRTEYSMNDLAAETGYSAAKLKTLIAAGVIPCGDVESKAGVMKFTPERYEEAVEVAKANELIKPTALAREVGITWQRLNQLVIKEVLPQPPLRIGETYYYYRRQLDEIQASVLACDDKTNPADWRRTEGFWSISEVARACGVARTSVEFHVRKKRIPKRTHVITGFTGHYYTTKERDLIVSFFKKRGKVAE